MPLIHVTLVRGRGEEEIAALGRAVTTAVHEALGTPREAIRVTVSECEPEHYFVGGETMAELRSSGRR
ncbi:2-hydroxymuconate tautomerase [Streptomyces sp. NPDC006923]|uniref:2-hydroxymuconate tautomerase n=1 Tax=Streptomyces sp. NPDC006923 TaxID=3155355 RepID=UPI0033FEA3DA